MDAVHAAVAQRAGSFQAEYGDKEKGLKIAAVPSHQQGPGVPHPQVGMADSAPGTCFARWLLPCCQACTAW